MIAEALYSTLNVKWIATKLLFKHTKTMQTVTAHSFLHLDTVCSKLLA